MKQSSKVLPALLGVAFSPLALACASCGCNLSTGDAGGYSTRRGWELGLEYTFIDQSALRHGNHTASAADVLNKPAVAGSDSAEIEQRTINRYLTAQLVYRPNTRWSLTAYLPMVDRTHSTYGQQDAPYTSSATDPGQLSSASVTGLGDVKLLAAYQGWLPTRNLGLQAGLKLPTGRYGGVDNTGADVGHPVHFGTSGSSAGQPLDTSLQAGTGSTDLIVGVYYYRAFSEDVDVQATAQYQAALVHALHQPGENFRPGNQTNLALGARYVANPLLMPELQLNVTDKRSDQGALADTSGSAGTSLYLSPGVWARLGSKASVYGRVQLPVYSHLAGYQLFPRWTATAGIRWPL